MSEEEIIKTLEIMCNDNFCLKFSKSKEAIQGILDLYKKEKETNRLLGTIVTTYHISEMLGGLYG